jgi:hypothetical protein
MDKIIVIIKKTNYVFEDHINSKTRPNVWEK